MMLGGKLSHIPVILLRGKKTLLVVAFPLMIKRTHTHQMMGNLENHWERT